MQFGCCVSTVDQLAGLEAAGCDYCELAIARMLMPPGRERDVAELVDRVARCGVKPRACNVFLPPHLPVVGPAVDRQEVERYVRLSFDRVSRLGGRPGLGRYDFPGFFRHLRAAGYGGDCSIECTWASLSEQIDPSLRYVRMAAQAAGW